MTQQPGTKLGPYEILSPLGAGGMGEVWKAKDARLDRLVAIKVLPEHLTTHADALARFEREARAVAALNHPNILGIFDIGQHEGTSYAVMELLEGETLRDRLAQGPLHPRKATELAVQMANGLAAAHAKGLIHRDLKPENLWITRDGHLKILDFGLAKQLAPLPPSLAPGSNSLQPTQAFDPSHAHHTEEGMILGTVGYMSPEQVRGETVDARSDIFSFGAVLFEMLTGKRAFARKSAADTLAAILKEEPPELEDASSATLPGLQRVIQHCLEKDPGHRFQEAHDLAFALESASTPSSSATGRLAALASTRPRRLWMVLVPVALLAGLLGAWWGLRRSSGAGASGEVRFAIPMEDSGGDIALDWTDARFAISPDGSRIAYVTRTPEGEQALCLRPVASFTGQILTTALGIGRPCWSPDSRSLAFSSDGKLKRVSIVGGEVQTICELPGGGFSGAAWHPDGFIIFGQEAPPAMDRVPGLFRVTATGGEPVPITWLDPAKEVGHRWPVLLPDGRHFIFQSRGAISGGPSQGAILLGSLDGKAPVRLAASPYKAAWMAPDWLIYVRGTSLVAQRARLDPPGLQGEAVVITESIAAASVPGNAAFMASSAGAILFRSGAEPAATQLAWFDRKGNRLGLVGEESQDVSVSLSPEGTRAAVATVSGRNDQGRVEPPVNLWIHDIPRNIRTRLTFNGANSDENPIFSPDGRRIAFATHIGGAAAKLFVKNATGSEETQTIVVESLNPHPMAWSPDGNALLIQQVGAQSQRELATLPPAGGGKATVYASGPPVAQGQFSPDGRYIAFASIESGSNEVFVRPFPKGEGKWQISISGGSVPRWRKDGKELIYMDAEGTLWAVPVSFTPSFEAGKPVALFKSGLRPTAPDYYGGAANYDVNKDGTRFLLLTVPRRGAAPPLNVILNWKPPEGRAR